MHRMVFLMALTVGCVAAHGTNQSVSAVQPGRPPAGPAPVVTGKVVRKSLGELQSFVGTVEAWQQVVVGSAVEGRVGEYRVHRGQKVSGKRDGSAAGDSEPAASAGQVLAQLETRTLDLQIETARTMFRLAEDAAAEQAANLPQEIEAAQSRVSETQSRLELSSKDLERMQRLQERNAAVSDTEIDLAQSQNEVNVELARQAAVELARLAATRELRLRQTQLRIRAAQQEIDRLEDLKSKYTIRAPFDGYVSNKLTDVGAWVRPGDPIAEIVHLDTVEFVFNVPQEFVTRVQAGLQPDGPPLTARIEIEGWAEPLRGTVSAIIPSGDLRSRTFPVRARMQNVLQADQPLLKPGMIGRAILELGPKREVLLIKKDALVLGVGQSLVYKLSGTAEQFKVQPVSVTSGASLGSWIEVQGDLTEQDRIVIEGNERLRADQAVKVMSSDSAEPPALFE